MKIGFIGLGNMGAPMAANLAAAGHAVTGFDTVAKPDGIAMAASAAEAASGAEVVITMLPNGAILRAVAAEIIPATSDARSARRESAARNHSTPSTTDQETRSTRW